MTIEKLKENKQLVEYVNLIENKNQVMNLTGFSGDQLWQDGIKESLLCLDDIKSGSLLDIGAGAGFPSVPLAITNPNVTVTIYEPLQKRTKFLEEVKTALKLNLDLKVLRAEETDEVELYDYVTARAVAPLRILIEIAHKPLKVNGLMLFPKGRNYEQEVQEAMPIMKKLMLTPEVKLIKDDGVETYLITIKKTKTTPKGVPRNWVQIKKG